MIFKKPIVTESAFVKQATGKYEILVERNATKDQIRDAFIKVFGVVPEKINTLLIKGKQKSNWKTRKVTKKSDRKKAIVTVKKDVKIDLLSLAKSDK